MRGPKQFSKQYSLSASLEEAAGQPMRATLKMKAARLRCWDLDIHYSSKEDLVRGLLCTPPRPFPPRRASPISLQTVALCYKSRLVGLVFGFGGL